MGQLWREIRRRLGPALRSALGMAAIGYFAYHLVEGDRGLIAWARISGEMQTANTTLAQLTVEREALENRVTRLRSDSLDPDLLDERARIMLGLIGKGEVRALPEPQRR